MVALSQMPTFLAVEQKKFYGDIVTPSELICENVGILVITRGTVASVQMSPKMGRDVPKRMGFKCPNVPKKEKKTLEQISISKCF